MKEKQSTEKDFCPQISFLLFDILYSYITRFLHRRVAEILENGYLWTFGFPCWALDEKFAETRKSRCFKEEQLGSFYWWNLSARYFNLQMAS